MAGMDPVSWDAIEAASGPPAEDVTDYVDRFADEVSDDPPGAAVKLVYDAWKAELGADRETSDQGAAFVIAYLLERRGAITFDAGEPTVPPLAARRPPAARLREWFWEREQTLWWIAVRTGVHYSLVTFWLWEDDIPLAKRNLTPDLRDRLADRPGDGKPG